MKRVHGVIAPNQRTDLPARVMNVQSKKHKQNTKIRLDKLLRMTNPVIGIHRRLGGIGDVLMTTPLLRAVKKLIPDCTLVYITDLEYAEGALGDVIRHNPYVDKLISNTQQHEYEYDYIVDVTATGLNREKPGRIAPNRIDMFADEVGVSVADNPVPIYIVTKKEKKQAIKRIKDDFLLGAKREDVNIIVIHAKSNDARRTWPLAYTDQLIDMLSEDPKNRVIVIDWGVTTKRWEAKTRFFPVLDESIVSVVAMIQQSDLVICPDSSILHFAGALGKKTITIFGPIPPESRINYYDNTSAVVIDLPCRPCFYQPRCMRANNTRLECLMKVTPKMIFDAANKKINEPLQVQSIIRHGSDITTVGKQDPIILVKRSTPGIGDLTMATPGIEALKFKYPTKQLHVAVQKNLCDVLKYNKYIDEVIDVSQPINLKRYEFIIDISSPCARYESIRLQNGKTIEKNRVEVFAEALRTRELITGIVPKFYLSKEELDYGKRFLVLNKCNVHKKTIGLSTRSAEIYRDWPEQHYKTLVNMLKHKYNLVVFHDKKVEQHENVTDATCFPFRNMASILSACDGLITVDTGLLHIAEALSIPTVALFGPIDYKARCKGYKTILVITGNLPCQPCWRNSHQKCSYKNSIKNYSECMEYILPKHVLKAAITKFK